MLVSEIRQKLVESGKFTEEEVNAIKGKNQLMEHYSATFGEELLDKIVVEDMVNVDIGNQEVQKEQITPSYLDPSWGSYVETLFEEKELSDKLPNVHGLRRVSELLLGPIIYSRPSECFIRGESPGHATCRYEVAFKWNRNEDGNVDLGDYGTRIFGAMGGSYEGNTDVEYAMYPEAIAETRAEVRALRKALRLHSVAAEEVSKKAAITAMEKGRTVEWNSDAKSDPIQVNVIQTKCSQLQISLEKLLSSRGIENVEKMTREQAAEIITWINKIQTNNQELSEDLKV